jgi:uncharacterized small protein (DUF1192 family)
MRTKTVPAIDREIAFLRARVKRLKAERRLAVLIAQERETGRPSRNARGQRHD